MTNEPSGITTIYQEIEDNKAVIDRALATLDKLVDRADGRDLLAKIRESRAAYVGSFTKVAQLLAQGSRDQATALMNTEIVPTPVRL
ncbi:MCP four helix bundle domain-containing protein [Paraburkholderia sp. BR14263]|uniref:MCP four helix bundle domain-containing protein n=1 Tax=unclassified Paraburkholderia TaxID=2615204 RepID=UPI0034CE90E4